MATPNEASVQSQINDVVEYLWETYQFGGTAATNLITLFDAIVSGQANDYSDAVVDAAGVYRQQFSDLLPLGRAMLDPLLLAYGKVLDFPDTDPQAILRRMFDDFVDNAKNVKTRGMTLASPASVGSPAGDGTIHRLKLGYDAEDIENQFTDIKTARCVADVNNGNAEGEETFEFRGGNPSRDNLLLEGSGKTLRLSGISGRTSESWIGNPSFAQFSGTISALTALTFWTATTALSNFTLVEEAGGGETYRTYNGEGTTPRSVRFAANDTLTQLFSVRGGTFSPGRPYYVQIAYKPESSADGTLTLSFGGVSKAVALAGSSWGVLRIDVNEDAWFRNFNKQDPGISIAWSGRTTGTVLVDDVIIAPYQPFDNDFYAIVGGATPFLVDDLFQWTDSETGAKVQFILWFLYDLYLPHDAAPTWSDP